MAEADTNVQSVRVRAILGEVVLGIALKKSEQFDGVRTRSRLETVKEDAADWVDVTFWAIRWFSIRSLHVPSSEVLADIMLKQFVFNGSHESLEGSDLNGQAEVRANDVELADKLLRAVHISILE